MRSCGARCLPDSKRRGSACPVASILTCDPPMSMTSTPTAPSERRGERTSCRNRRVVWVAVTIISTAATATRTMTARLTLEHLVVLHAAGGQVGFAAVGQRRLRAGELVGVVVLPFD